MSVVTKVHYDAGDRLFHCERVQDVEPIVERNKRLQTQTQTRAGSFRHIGSIPNVILEKWMNEDGVNVLGLRGDEWGQYIKRKLRDPDNAAFRTSTGRI